MVRRGTTRVIFLIFFIGVTSVIAGSAGDYDLSDYDFILLYNIFALEFTGSTINDTVASRFLRSSNGTVYPNNKFQCLAEQDVEIIFQREPFRSLFILPESFIFWNWTGHAPNYPFNQSLIEYQWNLNYTGVAFYIFNQSYYELLQNYTWAPLYCQQNGTFTNGGVVTKPWNYSIVPGLDEEKRPERCPMHFFALNQSINLLVEELQRLWYVQEVHFMWMDGQFLRPYGNDETQSLLSWNSILVIVSLGSFAFLKALKKKKLID